MTSNELNKMNNLLIDKRGQMVVTHDLSFRKFRQMIGSGGMLFPSLALQQIKSVSLDYPDLGFGGSSVYGNVRIVIDAKSLLQDEYNITNKLHIYDGDIYSTMVPPVKYKVAEDDLFREIETTLGSTELLESLMVELLDTVSDDAFEGGYTEFANFHAELVRTKAVKYLFSRDVAKDGIADIKDWKEIALKLDNVSYQYSDDRYEDYIQLLLDKVSTEKGMTVGMEYIPFENGVTQKDIVDYVFDIYPVTTMGSLLTQLSDEKSERVLTLDRELVNVLFSSKVESLYDLNGKRAQLIDAAGISPFSLAKANYANAIMLLHRNLQNHPVALVNEAITAILKLNERGGLVSDEKIIEAFSCAGVIADDDLTQCIKNCIESKAASLQPYFEAKYDGCLPLAAISHVVVPDIIKESVVRLLEDHGCEITVKSYKESDNILDNKWARLGSTYDFPDNNIYLLDKNGDSPLCDNKNLSNIKGVLPLPTP